MPDRVFHLNPSRAQTFISLGLFILAEIVLLCIPKLSIIKCVCTMLLIFYAYYLFGCVLPLCQSNSILSLEKQADGWWRVMCPLREYQAKQHAATTVTQWLTVVHFKAVTGEKLSAVISRDMLSKNDYRHLICQLIEPQAEAYDLHQ